MEALKVLENNPPVDYTPKQRETIAAYQRCLDQGISKPTPRDIAIACGLPDTGQSACNVTQRMYGMKRANI